MKVLVTGVNGFVGKHLVRELKSRGHTVVGLGNNDLDQEIGDLLTAYQKCDLTDPDQVATLPLQEFQAVVNLAGLAQVGASFGAEELYKKVNVGVLSTLGQQLLTSGSKTRLIAISTGAVYDPDQPMPLTETSQTIKDGSPYALSKLLMEEVAHQLRSQGMDCVIARPFNHAGPGQAPGFIIPDLYQRITDAKKTGKSVTVSPKTTKRDYTDVRDVVRAYADLVTAKTLAFDTYNICSGISHSGREILDLMLEHMNLSGKITIETDKSLIRPTDPADLYGIYERIKQETDWAPTIPFEQTVRDFIASAT